MPSMPNVMIPKQEGFGMINNSKGHDEVTMSMQLMP